MGVALRSGSTGGTALNRNSSGWMAWRAATLMAFAMRPASEKRQRTSRLGIRRYVSWIGRGSSETAAYDRIFRSQDERWRFRDGAKSSVPRSYSSAKKLKSGSSDGGY